MQDSNLKISEFFDEIADMLEILGENIFRVRAYRRASEAIRNLNINLYEVHKLHDEQIEQIQGIGKDLHLKITEILETGACKMHEELQSKLSKGILDMLKVRGLGPKKVKLFHEKLGINSIEELFEHAKNGELRKLDGMGEKSEQAIIESISQATHLAKRIAYADALKQAEEYIDYMKKCDSVEQIQFAGSLRRKKDTIGDIDILVSGKNSDEIFDHFAAYPNVIQVLGKGETKSSVALSSGMQVDLRIVDKNSFGCALLYFTGSKQFNIFLRTIALKKGLKINEYGIFKDTKLLASKTEQEIFEALDLEYVKPEDRNH